jgi:hypothetical protein
MGVHEEWARCVIACELGRNVEIHDNGREDDMYDLRIGSRANPEVAIECTSAHDHQLTKMLRALSNQGRLDLALAGDWIVDLVPGSTAAREVYRRKEGPEAKRRLEQTLRMLEQRGIDDFLLASHARGRLHADLLVLFEELGISRASCYQIPGNGKVYLSVGSTTGIVDTAGSQVPRWIGEFLRQPSQADNLRKLNRSNAAERHIFVEVAYGGAPFPVESYLMDDLDELPVGAPDLPLPVTRVWMVSAFEVEHGVRWDGSVWRRFRARGEGLDKAYPPSH